MAIIGTFLCFSTVSYGTDMVAELVSGQPLGKEVEVDTKATYYSKQDLKNDNKDLQMTQYDADMLFPIFDDGKNVWRAGLDLTNIDVNTKARLERHNNDPFPNSLYDVGASLAYRHSFDNGWQAGAHVRFGSASDKLFHSYDEMEGSATAFLKIPHNQYNFWVFLVDARNNRKHPVVPGFAYLLVLSETSYFVLGAPLTSVHFEPIDKLAIDVNYSLEGSTHAQATYEVNEKLDIFTGFDFQHQVFYREGRKDKEDGLFFYERKISLGGQYKFNDNITIGFEGGYALNRLIFEGESYEQRYKNRIDVEGGSFGSVAVDINF